MKTASKFRIDCPIFASLVFLVLPLAADAQVARSSGGSAAGSGAGAGSGTVIIKGHGQTLTKTLQGGNVRIVGDANTITIKGKINGLHIGGDENGVRVEQVKMISTKGDGNLVKWKSSAPKPTPLISDTGDHNTVTKDDGGSLTPPNNPAMSKTNAAKTGE